MFVILLLMACLCLCAFCILLIPTENLGQELSSLMLLGNWPRDSSARINAVLISGSLMNFYVT